MDETKRKFMGIVYLTIGAVSLLVGLSSTAELGKYYEQIPYDYVVLLILAYALSGTSFFFGVRCVR